MSMTKGLLNNGVNLKSGEAISVLPYHKKSINQLWQSENQEFVDNHIQLIKDRATFLSTQQINYNYLRVAKDKGYREANLELMNLSDRLKIGELRLWWGDDQIWDFCEAKSDKCKRLTYESPMPAWEIRELLKVYGLDMPIKDLFGLDGAVARTCDPDWWKRQVRKIQARECDEISRMMRLVHKDKDIYCAWTTKQNKAYRKKKNRQVLESMKATNELGHEFLLSELQDKSISNPKHKRVELMVRNRGFEEVAITRGDVGLFITTTAPSRCHPMKTVFSKRKDKKIAIPNKKYDGSTVRDTQAFHCRQFARLRSFLARDGVDIYGFRVAEPNHDGCPHWHFLIYCRPEFAKRVELAFRKYWLQEDGSEQGAKKHRVTCKAMEPEKGGATGYIAKYISKSIDGHGIDADLYGRDASDSARAVEAWASTHGIRQFQQIGGPSVTVWREIRRIKEDGENNPFSEIWQAAVASDWAAFTMLMGGPTAGRNLQPLRPLNGQMIKSIDEYYCPPKNKYGEKKAATILGVKWVKSGLMFVTRIHEWTIEKVDRAVEKVKQEMTPEKWGLSFDCKVGGSPPLDLCQ